MKDTTGVDVNSEEETPSEAAHVERRWWVKRTKGSGEDIRG